MSERSQPAQTVHKLLWFVGVAAFLYFVFPTPWIESGTGTALTRVNRFTGVVEAVSPNGWVSPLKAPQAIEVSDLRIEHDQYSAKLAAKLHNKTNQNMEKVWIEVSYLNRAGEVVATDSTVGHIVDVKAGDTVLVDESGSSAEMFPNNGSIRLDKIWGDAVP